MWTPTTREQHSRKGQRYQSNALELQQRLLSDMGRVGLLSKMPFTFPVEVRMFTTDGEGKPKTLELPITTRGGGV